MKFRMGIVKGYRERLWYVTETEQAVSVKPGAHPNNIEEIHLLSRRDQSASPLQMPADFSVWEHNHWLL
jgi:hypothetical protein